jgi:hypothetical protein
MQMQMEINIKMLMPHHSHRENSNRIWQQLICEQAFLAMNLKK